MGLNYKAWQKFCQLFSYRQSRFFSLKMLIFAIIYSTIISIKKELISIISTINEVTNQMNDLNLMPFEFDWTRKSSDNSVIYGATVEDEVVGLVEFERMENLIYNFMYLIEVIPNYRGTTVAGELLAFIGQDSINQGFDGFVVWESKSIYYEYYIQNYGAKPLMGRRLHFDKKATEKLIRRFLTLNYTQDDIPRPPMIVSEKREAAYIATPEEQARREKVIAEGEELIRKYGYGVVPPENRNDLTGLRFIPSIEAKLGRKITESEWDGMSIR